MGSTLAESPIGQVRELMPTKNLSAAFLAKYGPAPSAEEIDENRAEMFCQFYRVTPMIVANTGSTRWQFTPSAFRPHVLSAPGEHIIYLRYAAANQVLLNNSLPGLQAIAVVIPDAYRDTPPRWGPVRRRAGSWPSFCTPLPETPSSAIRRFR